VAFASAMRRAINCWILFGSRISNSGVRSTAPSPTPTAGSIVRAGACPTRSAGSVIPAATNTSPRVIRPRGPLPSSAPSSIRWARATRRASGVATAGVSWPAADRPAPLASTPGRPSATSALAGGAVREFWPALDPSLTTAMRFLGGARFIGPLNRGPGVYAFVFANGASNVVVAWSTGGTRSVPLATNGALAAVGAGGQVLPPVGSDGTGITVGADPVFVSNPAQSVVDEAVRTVQQGPYVVPREPDFSKADSVSATLGATNVEHGLYNQRLRALPSGGVVPVTVDGSEAVRTDQPKDAVYAYFDVDHSYVFYDDGRYDLLITIEVHKASAPDRVGFNLLYDSMSGYKFTPWQWVEAGKDWATYTFRLTDAGFSSTWGWDFAVNGAGDKKEDLVIRSVTVKKVLPSAP